MKVAFNEALSWESSKHGPNSEAWKVLPVNFATEHKQMLSHLAMLVSKSYLAIPKEYEADHLAKNSLQHRTKFGQRAHSDSWAALRLACKMFKKN